MIFEKVIILKEEEEGKERREEEVFAAWVNLPHALLSGAATLGWRPQVRELLLATPF
jgi:hypothetical protein